MGNWRTVTIRGHIDPAEAAELRRSLTIDLRDPNADWDAFGPLTITEGLVGLGDWVSADIDTGGNLAERDYDVDDVADHLRKVVTIAPSAELKVHCGDEWESKTCVATITVSGGRVEVGPPEVVEVTGVPEGQAMARLLGILGRR